MSKLDPRKWMMPLLQLKAHDVFLLRRLCREGLGFAAAAAGRTGGLPRALRQRLLERAVALTPSYPQTRTALGALLLEEGRVDEALAELDRAVTAASGRLEQPVLPLMAPAALRLLGFGVAPRGNFDEATALAVSAARISGQTSRAEGYLELREAMLGDPEAAIARLELLRDRGVLAEHVEHARHVYERFPERPDALVLYAQALSAATDDPGAHELLARDRHRFASHAPTWRESFRTSAAAGHADDARRCLDVLLRIDPDRVALAPLALDPHPKPRVTTPDPTLTPQLAVDACELRPGEPCTLRVALPHAQQGLHAVVLAPYGLGVTPAQRVVELRDGAADVTLRAHRPDRINLGRPWPVTVVVTDGIRTGAATVRIAVTDPEPGRVLAIVTDDHELHDGRTTTSAEQATRQLVDKAALCETIAEAHGARWGLMVEACAVKLLDWAAATGGGAAWELASRRYRELLVDSVARGHDLSLHHHAFYDPDSPVFGQELDAAQGVLRSRSELQFSPVRDRRFWHRAYPTVGRWSDPASKRGSILRSLALIEGLGRLGDPGFRLALFRAGSYDIGTRPAEIRGSLFAVRDAGILADSDVSKPRLYHRFDRETNYLCRPDDPRRPAETLTDAALLELVPEYNIEGDFLADAEVLDRYLDGRLRHLVGRAGVTVLTAMTHTKFINFRRGLDNESLERGYGDWAVIEAHLQHARAAGVRFVTIREAVDAAVHSRAPEPIVVRGEEHIRPADSPDGDCELVYPLRVLGQGVPLDEGHALPVSVRPPSFAAEHALRVEVRRAGRTVASRDGGGFDDLPFWLDEGPWELRVTVPAALGLWTDGRLLRAALPFRCANVLLGDAHAARITFHPDGHGAVAELPEEAHP